MVKKVLIVEDNALNMKMFDELLRDMGHETVQSGDGADVLDLARKHRPDLVIMDIQLPRVTGLELTQKLKADAALKDIPVLAVTAFELEGGIEEILAAGCDDVLGKPITVPALLETLSKYLS